MKILCDVCDKAEACLFCTADEAALCHDCDRTIHHANKLASKHLRFSLQHLDSKEIAQFVIFVKKDLLFCSAKKIEQYYAECDIPIHKANELTQKHSSYLLNGVKLYATSSTYQASTSCSGINIENGTQVGRSNSSVKKPRSASNYVFSSSLVNSLTSARCKVEDNILSDTASASTTSISEYLIETIPGWCVEDLLDLPLGSHGLCKCNNRQSTLEDHFSENCTFSFSSGNIASGVQPQYSPFSWQMVTVNVF